MEELTYEELISLSDDSNITYEQLPILTEEQRDKLYPTLSDYLDGIYGVKFTEFFNKKFNLSPTPEIRDYKGYLTYLKENISRIRTSYTITNKCNLELNSISDNIEKILFNNNVLGHDKAKDYIIYLASSISKIEDKLNLSRT
jgi:hypothetical protein